MVEAIRTQIFAFVSIPRIDLLEYGNLFVVIWQWYNAFCGFISSIKFVACGLPKHTSFRVVADEIVKYGSVTSL